MELTPETIQRLIEIGWRVGAAVLIILVAIVLARLGRRAVRRLMDRLTLTPSLENLFETLTFYGIWILGILFALTVVGVPITNLVAAASAITVAAGLALRDQISDITNAVIFLLFKPFEPGDVIRTGNFSGTVVEIQPFNTSLVQADNQLIHLSNSEIRRAGIVNFTKSGVLRADVVFRLTYDEDLRRARAVMLEVMRADERILAEPPPTVVIDDLSETGVIMIVRGFTQAADVWQVRWDLRERIKERLDVEAIDLAVIKAFATSNVTPLDVATSSGATSGGS
jgi:small conductance mechanosensitive channel